MLSIVDTPMWLVILYLLIFLNGEFGVLVALFLFSLNDGSTKERRKDGEKIEADVSESTFGKRSGVLNYCCPTGNFDNDKGIIQSAKRFLTNHLLEAFLMILLNMFPVEVKAYQEDRLVKLQSSKLFVIFRHLILRFSNIVHDTAKIIFHDFHGFYGVLSGRNIGYKYASNLVKCNKVAFSNSTASISSQVRATLIYKSNNFEDFLERHEQLKSVDSVDLGILTETSQSKGITCDVRQPKRYDPRVVETMKLALRCFEALLRQRSLKSSHALIENVRTRTKEEESLAEGECKIYNASCSNHVTVEPEKRCFELFGQLFEAYLFGVQWCEKERRASQCGMVFVSFSVESLAEGEYKIYNASCSNHVTVEPEKRCFGRIGPLFEAYLFGVQWSEKERRTNQSDVIFAPIAEDWHVSLMKRS